MTKTDKYIEIVRSSLDGMSSMSMSSCLAVQQILLKYYANVGITKINDMSDLERLVEAKPDLAFMGMKYLPTDPMLGRRDPNKIWVSAYLDQHDIAHTGSGQEAIELESSKPLAKQRVAQAGLNTAQFFTACPGEYASESDLPVTFPLFLKPSNMGGGYGIAADSVVWSFAEFEAKVASVAERYRSDILAEAYLPGREFSIALLRNIETGELDAMPIELVAEPNHNGDRMLSHQVKSDNAESVLAVADGDTRCKVIELAVGVYYALGARDYGRIDVRLDENGKPHFLEANLVPSLISGYGSFPKACLLNAGLDHETMIMRIVELGMARCDDAEQTGDIGLVTPAFDYSV